MATENYLLYLTIISVIQVIKEERNELYESGSISQNSLKSFNEQIYKILISFLIPGFFFVEF